MNIELARVREKVALVETPEVGGDSAIELATLRDESAFVGLETQHDLSADILRLRRPQLVSSRIRIQRNISSSSWSPRFNERV